ncbi:MAG: phosphodiester glycosidase family protein [Ktedonobacteraceae bacterium]
MPAKKAITLCLLIGLLATSWLACSLVPSVSYSGTPVTAPGNTGGVPDTPPLDVWTQARAGVATRYEHWKSAGNNEDTVTIVRFDPHSIHLSIGYQPDKPLNLSSWMKQTGAMASLNGGYFDEHNQATGLVISNGNVTGASYVGYGGMLAVDTQGNISLRSLHDQPYNPDAEQLRQATQSTPMLIINGQRTHFSADASSKRRTVVAMDRHGRLLFIISPSQSFSLDELADLLVDHGSDSDLGLQTALNLDGGSSTGLYLNAGGQRVTIDPITPLPLVISIK